MLLDLAQDDKARAIAERIVAKSHYYDVARELAFNASQFPNVKLYTVEQVFGGWDKVSKEHFAERAILDQVFVKR